MGYPYAYGITANGVPFGSSTGLDAITQGLDPVTQGAVVHHHVKRSADADADAYYAYGYPYAYGHHGYAAYGHHGYAGYPYAGLYGYAYHGVPFRSSTGLDPITQGLDASTQGYLPYHGYGYHGYGWGK